MKKQPEVIEIKASEFEDLKRRVEGSNLKKEDIKLLLSILNSFLWLKSAYSGGKLKVARLLGLVFGSKSEKRFREKKPKDSSTEESAPSEKDKKDKDPVKGHGRTKSEDYTSAKEVVCSHPNLKSGDLCPDCGQGRIYTQTPGVVVNITGVAPLTVTKYLTDKLRCNLCGSIFEAPLPPEATREERWAPSAKAMTTILKYGYGLPQYRQERLLKDHGLPIADSTLYDQSEEVANCARPIYEHLCLLASSTPHTLHTDDTTSRILALIEENKKGSPERKGIYTTAIIGTSSDGHKVYVFKSGRKNAGENLDEIFESRDPGLGPPRIMMDGSPSNFPETIKAIIHNCLTHGRREFFDIQVSFPQEVAVVLDLIGKMYANDEKTKDLSSQERLLYHQEHSKPVVEELYNALIEYQKTAEPNGNLGKAIKYMLKRWTELTRFIHLPGAPLDNNIAERAIKYFVLYRKNSYFYKTLLSAKIGDILISGIQTAVANGVSPFDYLTQIQINKKKVFAAPHLWLPWNYQQNLSQEQAPIST